MYISQLLQIHKGSKAQAACWSAGGAGVLPRCTQSRWSGTSKLPTTVQRSWSADKLSRYGDQVGLRASCNLLCDLPCTALGLIEGLQLFHLLLLLVNPTPEVLCCNRPCGSCIPVNTTCTTQAALVLPSMPPQQGACTVTHVWSSCSTFSNT